MSEPDRAADYRERDVEAAHAVLIELGQVLGAYREQFVIVGGAVPWLLLPDARPPHIGTLDLDLDLDPEALAGGGYAALVEALEKKDYERGVDELKPFQLRRWVRLDEGPPIAVIVDLLMPRDVRLARSGDTLVEGLRVQRADGAEVALAHHVPLRLEGKMPDGRLNAVDLLVASIPALLVMKGYALVGRDKKKDAYDIYFSVRNYDGGWERLAEACRPLLSDPLARKGYGHIAGKFRHSEDFGPTTVRRFVEESASLGAMTPDQVQTDAFMQVSAFLRALGLG